jgi:inhibitor of cysteine peptidase
MKKIVMTLMILVLMTGILAACGPAGVDQATISEQDGGKTIQLKVGDTLAVALEGNITTGYNWVAAPQDPALLEQLGEAEVTPDSNLIGAPGKIVLQFKAIEKGETNLHLDYKRPWEQDAAPEKTFDVTVVVK